VTNTVIPEGRRGRPAISRARVVETVLLNALIRWLEVTPPPRDRLGHKAFEST